MLLPEILVLALGCILALAHILLAAHFKTRQYGVEWNVGARDADKEPLNDIAGRLDRARGNYLETFPVAIVALFGVVLAGKGDGYTALLGWTWLGARVLYLPLYWAGIAYVRTLVWAIALLALLGLLYQLVFG